MFDYVEIEVIAGKGGDGAIGFRREKFVPFGGPDGGDGGDGGDVIIMADPAVSSLRQYQHKRLYRAGNGRMGSGQRKHGRMGETTTLLVPQGTVVSSKSADGGVELIADLEQVGEQVIVARGGKGGWGNTHFTSSTNQAPQIAQKGQTGKEVSLVLEMRLIADVGIIGFPNAGKSTLLAAATAARPKVASYPFTTLEPVLGTVIIGQRSFVMAEIPGLIEGAHLGRGLGHDFLRHVMRTRMLLHLIDGTSASPVEDMVRVNSELSLFDPFLGKKPQLVVVNKIDLPEVRARLAAIEESFSGAGVDVSFVSADSGEGVSELVASALRRLDRIKIQQKEVGAPKKIFRPQPRAGVASVRKEGDVFVIQVPGLERLTAGVRATDSEVQWQLKRQLVRMGINKVLEKAGVKTGDRVRCGDLEWEW